MLYTFLLELPWKLEVVECEPGYYTKGMNTSVGFINITGHSWGFLFSMLIVSSTDPVTCRNYANHLGTASEINYPLNAA